MRDSAGKIVLMDFGTGRDTVTATAGRATSSARRPTWRRNCSTGEPASVQSDVYAVGVLLYHLVTGHYPVEGGTVLDLVDAHQAGRRRALLDRRPDLPLPFVQVVSKALSPIRPNGGRVPRRCSRRWAGCAVTRTEENTWVRTIARVAAVVVSGLAALTVLGMVTSRYFNFILGREEFAQRGPWRLALLGRCLDGCAGRAGPDGPGRARLPAGWALRLRHAPLASAARAAADRLVLTARRLGLDDVESASAGALVTSVAVLAATWWYLRADFWALFAVTPNIGTTPAETLAYLSPIGSSNVTGTIATGSNGPASSSSPRGGCRSGWLAAR